MGINLQMNIAIIIAILIKNIIGCFKIIDKEFSHMLNSLCDICMYQADGFKTQKTNGFKDWVAKFILNMIKNKVSVLFFTIFILTCQLPTKENIGLYVIISLSTIFTLVYIHVTENEPFQLKVFITTTFKLIVRIYLIVRVLLAIVYVLMFHPIIFALCSFYFIILYYDL